MPQYVIEREIGAFDAQEILASGQALAKIADEIDGIRWIRSYLSETEGKVYCVYEAPNPDILREHAERIGSRADKISLVQVEMEPSMFR